MIWYFDVTIIAGAHCEEDINECLSMPCTNGGVCKDLVNVAVCLCPLDRAGPTCERQQYCLAGMSYHFCYPLSTVIQKYSLNIYFAGSW